MFINECFAQEDSPVLVESTTVEDNTSNIAAINNSSSWTNLVPIGLMLVVFYFLLIRPQEKKRKEHEELIGGVKKGEQVITSSGIYGTVTKVNDDNTVEVEISKDINIKILKTAIIEISSREKLEKNQLINKAKK